MLSFLLVFSKGLNAITGAELYPPGHLFWSHYMFPRGSLVLFSSVTCCASVTILVRRIWCCIHHTRLWMPMPRQSRCCSKLPVRNPALVRLTLQWPFCTSAVCVSVLAFLFSRLRTGLTPVENFKGPSMASPYYPMGLLPLEFP